LIDLTYNNVLPCFKEINALDGTRIVKGKLKSAVLDGILCAYVRN
jgi:hypothetical protein